MPTQWHETANGRFRVSTPELTSLELVQRMQLVGGAARVLEVLRALADSLTERAMRTALDAASEVPAAQRLGTLFGLDGRAQMTNLIQEWLVGKRTRFIPLNPGDDGEEPTQADMTFKVRVPLNFQAANS